MIADNENGHGAISPTITLHLNLIRLGGTPAQMNLVRMTFNPLGGGRPKFLLMAARPHPLCPDFHPRDLSASVTSAAPRRTRPAFLQVVK